MIAAAILAVVGAVVWILDKAFAIRREVKIAKAEDSHKDAQKIIAGKADTELVDDFNKRYSLDSLDASGHKDGDSKKGSTG